MNVPPIKPIEVKCALVIGDDGEISFDVVSDNLTDSEDEIAFSMLCQIIKIQTDYHGYSFGICGLDNGFRLNLE